VEEVVQGIGVPASNYAGMGGRWGRGCQVHCMGNIRAAGQGREGSVRRADGGRQEQRVRGAYPRHAEQVQGASRWHQ